MSQRAFWVSLLIGLMALSLIDGANYLLLSAAEDREALHSPHNIDSGKSDIPTKMEAYFLDHSVVNRENLSDEPNPGPMAIAAYE
jgi:hypothetical protein